MWISRKEWLRAVERIEALEGKVRELGHGPKAYFADGKVNFWPGGYFSLADALNSLAKHVGMRWRTRDAVEAVVEAQPVGKPAEGAK